MVDKTRALPLELMNGIVSHFAKNELKVLRLVCKLFEKAASQLLFDQVVISNNFACLKTAKGIIGSFNSIIKTIVYCPVFYQDLTQEQLASEQREIMENGECLAMLSIAFRASTNARALVFGGPSEIENMREWGMQRYGVSRDDLCPSSGCTIETRDHLDFYITPGSYYRRPMEEMWYPAMTALSASDSQISEIDLSIGEGWGWDSCLSISAFDSTLPQVKYVRNRLEVLVKLRLELGLLPTDSAEQACCNRGDVAKALSTAHNLETLWLHACRPNWNGNGPDLSLRQFRGSLFTPLDLFLGGCQLPRLQSLILQSFEATVPDLLALLQGSPHLQSLALSAFSLTRGSWEGFVEQARGTLKLKRIILHYLHGFGYAVPWNNYLVWHTPMVDDFFFGSGENPFTRDAVIQHKKDECNAFSSYKPSRLDPRAYLLEWSSRFGELEDEYYGTQHTCEQG